MIGLITGSTAIKHWFPDFPREPGDLDIWSPEVDLGVLADEFPGKRVDAFWDDRIWDNLIPKWVAEKIDHDVLVHAFPNELYTIKVAHSSWDLANKSWHKHMHDIVWLKQHGATLMPGLWKVLYSIAEDQHGSKRVNLNQESGAFFTDAVVRKYDHDSLHDTVAHYHRPLWEEVLKDGEDVAMDMAKVWALPFEDQIKLFREEVYATALERWLIPADYEFSPSLAYSLALRKTITSLTKGASSRFMIENYETFRQLPKTWTGEAWYMVNHFASKHLLKPLES